MTKNQSPPTFEMDKILEWAEGMGVGTSRLTSLFGELLSTYQETQSPVAKLGRAARATQLEQISKSDGIASDMAIGNAIMEAVESVGGRIVYGESKGPDVSPVALIEMSTVDSGNRWTPTSVGTWDGDDMGLALDSLDPEFSESRRIGAIFLVDKNGKITEKAKEFDPLVEGRYGKGGPGTHDYMSFS